MSQILYKYLDINGGKMMLYYRTLMFTNATKLNDCLDCHQDLIDYSNVPEDKCRVWPSSVVSLLNKESFRRNRENAYICSLSKVNDSARMWGYYTMNRGLCIGIDIEKTREYYSQMLGLMVGCKEYEVKYVDIRNKPDYFRSQQNLFDYQIATKDRKWAHEQEVRIVAYHPSTMNKALLPGQDDKDGPIDWKDVHAFIKIGPECFESVYMGTEIRDKDKNEIIQFARACNPSIKVYQMKMDTGSLSLVKNLES